MSERITVYERVYFDKGGQPIKWLTSLDGICWEVVEWPGEKLPFILIKRDGEIPEYVQTERWEMRP